MKIILRVFVISLSWLICGCSSHHLISDRNYRAKVIGDYKNITILAKSREKELFSFQDGNLPTSLKEAMEFLFAYMPLSDLADYDGDYFLANARLALRTRAERQWGDSIPEHIFLHYLLPVRINNENLDSFRIKYFEEISSRIKGLDARSSALEINHWCHEKVTYQPSDERTSAPMSTILSARGRCGEESTFTVAALRTAGLPARQVYTPRWAHSDDNHAWVEVWVNGHWYYMGACEPEPVLDRGWFTEPARRAMLIHTKSFGAPYGESNQTLIRRNYSIINNLSKYAITKTLFVKVTDTDGHPASGTSVEFQLYNYAEFYPLATLLTDKDGLCHFETGLGDLLIWAHLGDKFNYRKISVNETDTLSLVIDRKPEVKGYYELDLGVPVVRPPFEGPSQDLASKNNELINNENTIRQKYIETWMKPGAASALVLSGRADTAVIKDIIRRSMGNFREISFFIKETPDKDLSLAIKMLTLVSDKDIRDVKEKVLMDHLQNVVRFDSVNSGYDRQTYNNYILNPRIANEMLVPWRKYLRESLPADIIATGQKDPEIIVSYVKKLITPDDSDNYYRTPITPIGVSSLKIADDISRNIFFISICRSIGIPARLEPGSNLPQFYSTGKWHDAVFAEIISNPGARGYIKLTSEEKQPVPEYYIHFTLARFVNGRYNTLEYDYNKRITDFKDELALAPGFYMLITGNRLNDSSILSSLDFFELKENEHKKILIRLRKENSGNEIMGKLKMDSKFYLPDGSSKALKDVSGKGIVIAWIEPDMEPTKHILNDLPLLKREMDSWGGSFIFLSDKPGLEGNISSIQKKGLPEKSIYGYEKDSGILKQLCGGESCSMVRFPMVILVSNNGNILFKSEGYRIGIGEQILSKVR